MFLVLGNVTIDESMATPTWPTPGQTIVVGAPRRDLGGKGANQAIVASRAGAPVRFVAAIGRDADGDWAVERLRAEGLDSGLIRVDAATDKSLIFVSPTGENAIASTVDAATTLSAECATILTANDHLLMQGNLSLEVTKAAFAAARAAGVRTAFNPSPIQAGAADLLPFVDLLIVNQGEAEMLGGASDPQQLAHTLRQKGAGAIALTLGARGSIFVDDNGVIQTPALPAKAIDTTGAGDAFAGVLVSALFHRKLAPAAALQAATAAAALTVQRPGAASAFPSRDELDAIFAV